jgi:hypothetical protein
VKTKFTPGPWGIEQTNDTNWIGPLRADGKVAFVVADTDREGLKPEALERNDANAHLLAAAPDLYEALEEARGYVDRTPQTLQRKDMLSIIDNAIARAEGRVTE